jgi:poly-gamma-glutamate synthesis protein (capsule biosynthesis protein)
VQAKIDQLNDPDYPYAEIAARLQSSDLTVGVFNAVMSDSIEQTGCVYTFELVGRTSNAAALRRAGFDLVGAAANHIMDCGLMKAWCYPAFFDTLDGLHAAGIRTVGAGRTLEEALQPVIIELNGVKFGFVSLGNSKQRVEMFARPDRPGIAELTPENLRRALADVRTQADVVIALPHWGSEYNVEPNWDQQSLAKQLVEAGADLVIGNHTHVVQRRATINGTPVFYGLGNFVFDQGLPETRQSVLVEVTFEGKRIAKIDTTPLHVDGDGRVHLAAPPEAQQILDQMTGK